MVDVTHEDTKKDKETIRTLKEEIVDLNKKLEQQPGVLTDQDQMWAFNLDLHLNKSVWLLV